MLANVHPVTGKPGWWEIMVGPGKPIDTERYFVICANVVGGCLGTTGPASLNPATGGGVRPRFSGHPPCANMVRAQAMLLDHLGIDSLFSVAGGSMGGHAGAAMGSELSGAGCSRRFPLATATPAFGAEHCFPRGSGARP